MADVECRITGLLFMIFLFGYRICLSGGHSKSLTSTSSLSTLTGPDCACRQSMDPNNLQVASNYINNVLLARGLLRSGKPIDFAQPENEEGGAEATMARVINLVNDLVLRRDVCL